MRKVNQFDVTPSVGHVSSVAPSHTPGPWREVSRRDNQSQVRCIIADTEPHVYIATIESETDHPRYGYFKPGDAAEANARLIAAAPELLEALKRLLEHAEGHNSDYDATSAAERAISKAERGQ